MNATTEKPVLKTPFQKVMFVINCTLFSLIFLAMLNTCGSDFDGEDKPSYDKAQMSWSSFTNRLETASESMYQADRAKACDAAVAAHADAVIAQELNPSFHLTYGKQIDLAERFMASYC